MKRERRRTRKPIGFEGAKLTVDHEHRGHQKSSRVAIAAGRRTRRPATFIAAFCCLRCGSASARTLLADRARQRLRKSSFPRVLRGRKTSSPARNSEGKDTEARSERAMNRAADVATAFSADAARALADELRTRIAGEVRF